jgi:23S rRNA (guanosine2251-2'-O)-methyltransferase
VRRHVQIDLRIPMAGDVESLNVASAAAVLSFELLRRRLGDRTE